MKYVIILFTGFIAMQFQQRSVEDQILSVTKSMEKAWRNNNKIDIAQAYTDDTYVISPRGIEAHGRTEINAYWRDFRGKPIEWKLTNYLISKELEKIRQHPRWQARKRTMPQWSDHDIILPENHVFQYGQSLLVRERESKLDTSTVEFLLVWQNTPNGWKIFLDAYN